MTLLHNRNGSELSKRIFVLMIGVEFVLIFGTNYRKLKLVPRLGKPSRPALTKQVVATS